MLLDAIFKIASKTSNIALVVVSLFPIAARSDQLPHLHHHRVTWQWLGVGSLLREQVDAFANGVLLGSLPLLHVHVAELRFTPTAERAQEADHSMVRRSVGHRKVKGPFVSLSL